MENHNLNHIQIEQKEASEALLDKESNIRISKEAASINKKSDKNIDKYFNNSSMMISEIRENTDKSKFHFLD